MLTKLVNGREAANLLEMNDVNLLEAAVKKGELNQSDAGKSGRFAIGDLAMYKLGQVLVHVGVDSSKAYKYSEAILSVRLHDNEHNLSQWIENETQELFCSIADDQLARIFLRNKDDQKEVDVGAIKPILFPTTRCEINVFRVIRPVIYRARQLFSSKSS
jgi:hypothetical protein